MFFFTAPSIQVCSRNDPDIGACVRRSLENLRPILSTGETYDNFVIPSLEPLNMGNIILGHKPDSFIELGNLICTGGSQFKVEKLK
jgi:Haemolymph juvenile hormone binding protein (JHBP)